MLKRKAVKMIHEFYAVTTTSVYHVKDGKQDNEDAPFCLEAVKIALRGESKIPVGGCLKNGTMLAICNQLIMFIPEGGGLTSFQRKIEEVNTRWWGGHSSSIVALFPVNAKERKRARGCFQRKNIKPCDPRWLKDTMNVIKQIGHDHPIFEICRYPGLCLPALEKKAS